MSARLSQSPWNQSCRQRAKPRGCPYICKTRAESIADHSAKFASAKGTNADMTRPGSRFLRCLQVTACLCASLTAQEGKPPVPANTNVTAEDLLTQPVGAD